MDRKTLAAALLAGASTLVFATMANAQQTRAPAPSDLDEVVVTGSRVMNGNNSPTPVTVVPIEDLMRTRPTTVADVLNDLPQFSGSRTPLGNPTVSSGTVQNGGGNSSANILNLRNLGQNRTLILFDGHRMGPITATGLIDVDMIPQMMIQRVDVVTGGVSAVYGSDAVTGVVNFITDKNFNGFKAKAQYGMTEKGDNRTVNYGFAAGRSIAGGRGHIEGSYEYRDDPGIGARSQRDPDHETWSVQGSGTAAAPFFLTPNARSQNFTFGGLIRSGVLAGQTFKQNGVLSPFIHGTTTVPGSTTSNEIGGDGIYFDSSLKGSNTGHQVFGRFDYDVTDTIHGFVEATYNRKKNNANIYWQNLNQVTLSSTNAFLPAVYQQQLAAAKQATFTFSKQMLDVNRQFASQTSTQAVINAGLDGTIGKTYKWEVGYLHSDGELIGAQRYNVNNARLSASLDAVKDATGNVVCSVTITNPGLYPGCVPLNPFGPTSDSQSVIDYITGPSQLDVRTSLDDFSGSISGSPVSTWAGPVTIAASAEYRKLSASLSSTTPTGELAGPPSRTNRQVSDCTGLRFNCTATTVLWQNQVANRPLIGQTVREGALEADVPLLKDKPFFQALNVNLAARYTEYQNGDAAKTGFNATTWKLGLDWRLNDELRVRATRSRDIRAPTLDDLFSPTSSSVANGTTLDRLTGQQVVGVVNVVTSNPNLTPEVGDTKSAGVVYRPDWLPGFSVSVDYFNIKVSNAIIAILASNVTAQNACIASLGTSAYCAAQVRPLPYTNTTPANNLTKLISTNINLSEQDTHGADVEVNYATQFLSRPASARLLTTWQPEILYVQPALLTLNQAGAAFGNNGITAAPVWRVTGLVRFQPLNNFTIDLQGRWRSKLHESGDPTLVFSCCEIPSVAFFNMGATYQIKSDLGQTDVYFTVSNLLNTYGPHAAPFTNANPGQQYGYVTSDDPLGRSFTLGVRFRH